MTWIRPWEGPSTWPGARQKVTNVKKLIGLTFVRHKAPTIVQNLNLLWGVMSSLSQPVNVFLWNITIGGEQILSWHWYLSCWFDITFVIKWVKFYLSYFIFYPKYLSNFVNLPTHGATHFIYFLLKNMFHQKYSWFYSLD